MTTINQSIQSQFGNVAENYRHSEVHAQGADLQRMVELVQQGRYNHAIDLGCGAGHVADMIAYDLTPQMLEQVELQARERGLSNLITRQGDASSLPFEDSTFDVVLSRYSAHHWQRPQTAVHEVVRVLKTGGVFILSDIVAPDAPLQDTFLQTIEYLRDTSHVRDYRIVEWTTWFQAAGLTVIVDREWMLPIEFDQWVQRIATPQSHITLLRKLFLEAATEIRETFALSETHFQISGALIVGTK